MARKLLVTILALALLLAMPVIAVGEAQEKSWDINGDHLYGILMSQDGDMNVIADPENSDFGWAHLQSADNNYPEGMKGTWSIKRVSGDEVEVEARNYEDSPNTADCHFVLTKGEGGQSAVFMVTFSSDGLQNDVVRRFNVSVIDKVNDYANEYAYDETKHTVKTGKHFRLAGGHILPEGAKLYRPLQINYYVDEKVYDFGWIDVDRETGEIYGCVREPGTYIVRVFATFMENVQSIIEHTIEVVGKASENELPDEFLFEFDRYDYKMVYDEDEYERRVNEFWLCDDWAWGEDKLEWSYEQVGGEKVNYGGRLYEDSNTNGELFVDGALPIGEYEFKVTVKDITRDEEFEDTFNLAVIEDPGEVLPERLDYKKIKQGDVITIKSGKTLNFGAPNLYPANSTIPDEYRYGVWIEDFEGNWENVFIKEDQVAGAHILGGDKEGAYTVHAYLDMYGGTRGAEDLVFTLVVQSPTTKINSITFDKQGDWDNAYPIVAGKPTKIKATILPKNAGLKTLRWESDWPEAISVDQKGVVTGNMVGEWVEIRAFSMDGSDIEQQTVLRVVPVTATKISMPKKLSMKVDEAKTLAVKFKPKNVAEDMQAIVWESDDTTVAEVNRHSGEITANAPGKATIYAYAIDYNYDANMKVFAKCKVTVK